jgi:hypothetical protein
MLIVGIDILRRGDDDARRTTGTMTIFDGADHVSLQARGMLRLTIDLPLGGNPCMARTIASHANLQ